MFNANQQSDSHPSQGADPPPSSALARSWLYRLAEQSGFGQLERQAPQDSRLPPDFDQRVRQVGEW
jgi:hypothetical protein